VQGYFNNMDKKRLILSRKSEKLSASTGSVVCTASSAGFGATCRFGLERHWGRSCCFTTQTGKLVLICKYEEDLNVLTFGTWMLVSQGSASSQIICLFLQVNSSGQMKITVQRHNKGRCIDWVENCSYINSFPVDKTLHYTVHTTSCTCVYGNKVWVGLGYGVQMSSVFRLPSTKLEDEV